MSVLKEFVLLGDGGLGNPKSTIAHSMAWFRDTLYVGCTNPGGASADDCARIMRLTADGDWEEAFRSPLREADARANAVDRQLAGVLSRAARRKREKTQGLVPRDNGYRAMVVFQGRSDPHPCLYTTTLSPWGGLVLRSEDGVHFEPVGEPGLGNSEILSFRGLCAFGDKLFASPAGTSTDTYMDRNFAPETNVFVSSDPLSGEWYRAAEDGFGDANNRAVYSMTTFAGSLYAGTANSARGFQIWKTEARGNPPFQWHRVLGDGASRFNLNMAPSCMVEFDGYLYIGGGLPGFGYDKVNDVGPAAAELIRLAPDGQWELIFGIPRFSWDGLKIPLSLHGEGLDDPYNSVVWSMGVHENVLYVGTHQWEPFDSVKQENGGVLKGGYQVWATTDGRDFEAVTLDAFGVHTDTGLRTILSTPLGLVLGTANHLQLIERLGRLSGASLSDTGGSGGFRVWLGVE